MPARRRGPALRPVVAVVLLLLGIGVFGLSRILDGTERLPWAHGGAPPASSHVTRDHTYSLAVPGGVPAMLAHGVPVAAADSSNVISLQCTYTPAGELSAALTVSPEHTDTKAEDTVGRFVAPVTGRIHVDCQGWGAMFVPDSDDRPADAAGWALVLSLLALGVGAGLGLTELRLWWERRAALRAAYEQEKVERLADVSALGVVDREVGGADGGDVGA